MEKNRFNLPIPNGWYAVAWSKDLAPGEVQRAYYFDRELVIFRTESGRACVFDAYCPHLGAHLGAGGTVEGETLRCPFHAWRYDCEGACVDIPYAKRIPPNARAGAWEVIEANEMIFVWHHIDGKPPFFEMPILPEFGHSDWAADKHWEKVFNAHVQDMAENNCDPVHFRYVHNNPEPIIDSAMRYDGLKMTMSSTSKREAYGGVFELELERETWGIGLASVRIVGLEGAGLLMFSSTTPVDGCHSHSRWAFAVTKNMADTAGQEFIDSMTEGVLDDLPIWDNKIHRSRPLLCDGDHYLAEFRRWASNFYSDPDAAGRAVEAPGEAEDRV
jgi:nitrite reductase/ring-hydroxylating ferredoxin subunit